MRGQNCGLYFSGYNELIYYFQLGNIKNCQSTDMKKEIADYFVVTDFEKSSLERVVKEMIKQGYFPLGGVSIAYSPNYFNEPMGVIVYAQSMVKYVSE